jgi:hypothetical protein
VTARLDALRPGLPAGTGGAPPAAGGDKHPDGETPAASVTWHPDLAAAEAAAAEGKMPLFAAFDGAADAPGQKAFDDAIARPEVRALLSKFACVRLQAHGDAGAVHLARLDKVSVGAKPPHAMAVALASTAPVVFAPEGEGDALAKALEAFLERALGRPAEPAPPVPPVESEPPKPADAAK